MLQHNKHGPLVQMLVKLYQWLRQFIKTIYEMMERRKEMFYLTIHSQQTG